MSNAYQKTPSNMMDREEVEQFLGITYQTFRKTLTPDNAEYTGLPGFPKNLYSREKVEQYKREHFDENGKHIPVIAVHNFDKPIYSHYDTKLKLERYFDILEDYLPIAEVKQNKNRVTKYYNKRTIDNISRLRISPELMKIFIKHSKEVMFDYSGRYMFGSICVGFITENDQEFIKNVFNDLDGALQGEFLRFVYTIQVDDMGLDRIVYITNSYTYTN